MSWLRLEDDFIENPKVEALTDRQFRVWIRLLCYCARQRNGGELPTLRTKRSQIVPGLSVGLVAKLSQIGLVDCLADGRMFVHDFAHYNPSDPTAASRMQRYRERNAERNGAVTESVTALRSSRARVPVPSPTTSTNNGSLDEPPVAADDFERINQLMAQAAVEEMPE